MYYFLIFFFELLVLFFLSRFVTRAISGFFYQITKSEKASVLLLATIFFPGTLLHELAHYFFALLCLVHVGEIEFVPKVREGSVKLGSVAIAHTDPFRRSLIGLAPMVVGLSCISIFLYFFSSFPLSPWYLNTIIILFVVFEISNTMFSSKRDVEGIVPLVVALGIIGLILYLAHVRFPAVVFSFITSGKVQMFFQQLCLYMLVPLIIDGGIIVFSKLLKTKNQK